MFKLSNGPGSLGLSCNENGLALAGVPLLRRTGHGFTPRSQAEIARLIGHTYGTDTATTSIMGGLTAVARALNDNAIARAMIAAVQLKLPELDWKGAVRIAQAEAALAKFDPNEPRDSHGRWTREGNSATDGLLTPLSFNPSEQAPPTPATQPGASTPTPVTLPPGKRVDELGDLLEWIANATPEDEVKIRAEIKRLYYDVGDIQGGNAMNLALSRALQSSPTNTKARQAILDTFDPYTRADPAEMGQFTQGLVGSILLGPFGAVRAPAGVGAAAELAGTTAAPSEVWKLGWAARGFAISEALGAKLADNFPVIDRFVDGIATSIKSIDLSAATYQSAARLMSRINRYVDEVAAFNGAKWGADEVESSAITGRALNLAVPKGSITATQQAAIDAARVRAKSLGVDLIVTPF
jgi:hypothetical protein